MYALRDASDGRWLKRTPSAQYVGTPTLGEALIFSTFEEVLRWAGSRAVSLSDENIMCWGSYFWRFELVALERTVVESVTVTAPEGGLVLR